MSKEEENQKADEKKAATEKPLKMLDPINTHPSKLSIREIHELEHAYRTGTDGVQQNWDKVFELLQEGASRKDPLSTFNLGVYYQWCDKKYQAHQAMLNAMRYGSIPAKVAVAEKYLERLSKGEPTSSVQDIVRLLREAAENEEQPQLGACLAMGVLKMHGRLEVPVDREEARKWFLKSQKMIESGSYRFCILPSRVIGFDFIDTDNCIVSQREIGRGMDGTAYLIQLSNGHRVVMKELHANEMAVVTGTRNLLGMLAVCRSSTDCPKDQDIRHPNIVDLHAFSSKGFYTGHIRPLLDYCEYGSLKNIFADSFEISSSLDPSLDPLLAEQSSSSKESREAKSTKKQRLRDFFLAKPERLLFMAQDIVYGLSYMHDCGLAHGDIALQNLVLHSSGKVKIIDFARSRFYQDEKKDSHVRRDIDHVGQVLFRLATGRRFAKGFQEVLRQETKLERLDGIPYHDAIWKTIRLCLSDSEDAKKNRPITATDLLKTIGTPDAYQRQGFQKEFAEFISSEKAKRDAKLAMDCWATHDRPADDKLVKQIETALSAVADLV